MTLQQLHFFPGGEVVSSCPPHPTKSPLSHHPCTSHPWTRPLATALLRGLPPDRQGVLNSEPLAKCIFFCCSLVKARFNQWNQRFMEIRLVTSWIDQLVNYLYVFSPEFFICGTSESACHPSRLHNHRFLASHRWLQASRRQFWPNVWFVVSGD